VDPTIDRLKKFMDMYPNIPHCSDEVQGGMGRTGKMFGYEWYDGLKPKFVILGKMLGGGLPLSALCGPKEILEDEIVTENAHLHSTHSGNPLMAAVGCYVIERIQKEFMVERSLELGMLLESCLQDIKQRHHCGRGLLAGIEFEGPLMASLVVRACRRRGLLVVDTGRKWVKIGPQLTITADEILTGCDILKAAIEEVENDIEAQRDTSAEPDKVDTGLQEPGVRDLPEDGKPTSTEDA
jgi:acetylornithine/succinyldiaminopimelate/putrescine aminotransferase